jgi:hypothetical protein
MPELATIQRNLTVNFIDQRRLNVSAVWFKNESAVPVEGPAQTVTRDWLIEGEERNLGAELRDGFVELQIKAPDDVWFKLFASQVDARAAWGGHLKPVSSVLFKIDDPASVDAWIDRWPRGSRDNANAWVETKLAYTPAPTKRAKLVPHYSAPLPGSRFAGTTMVWRPMGKPAANDVELGTEDLEARPVPATNMETICRAIAFATLGYWVNVYLDHGPWDESLLRTLGGWIAREAFIDGPAVNAKGKSLEGLCWAPVDGGTSAAELIRFLGGLGAPKALEGFFHRAEQDLERNRQAPISGWPAMERTLGVAAKIGVRRAFRAGGDVEALEVLSERYALDLSDDTYVDRDALIKGLPFEFKHDVLVARHAKDEPIRYGRKVFNPFQIYAGSKLRTDVELHEFRPGQEPAAILRYSRARGLVTGDDRYADEFKILNTFPGFSIKPIGTKDPAIWAKAITMLDQMLGYLCRDNDAQMMWLKKFIAWTLQHPDIKQQSCPVIIGGQGIGKSRFGSIFLKKIFGGLAGLHTMVKLDDDRFLITPFIGKLVTFIDEVRMESVTAINIIKNIIRADIVSGQKKFGHQQDWYIPSRLILATNTPDIGLTSEDAADRAFFFIVSHTIDNSGLGDKAFLDWAYSLKPFYNELEIALESLEFKQHLMRYFMDLECTREELEDLTHSSRTDASVVQSTMSKARKIGRYIVADARVISGLDITAWFSSMHVREAIKRWDDARNKVEATQVIEDWKRSGVLDQEGGDLYKFKWGYGLLLQKLGEAHNLLLPGNHPTKPGSDWEPNDVRSTEGAPPWRGNRAGQRQQSHRDSYDPDNIGMSD